MNGFSSMKRTASTSSSILAVSSAITFGSGKPAVMSAPAVLRSCRRDQAVRARSTRLRRQLPHPLRCVERRSHDVLVAGAAAEIAGDGDAHLLLGRVGIVAQELEQCGEHAGGAEAALQAMMLVKALLQHVQLVRRWR